MARGASCGSASRTLPAWAGAAYALCGACLPRDSHAFSISYAVGIALYKTVYGDDEHAMKVRGEWSTACYRL